MPDELRLDLARLWRGESYRSYWPDHGVRPKRTGLAHDQWVRYPRHPHHTLRILMLPPLTKAAHYRAYAATSVANAETALDRTTRDVHLAIARHFYSLAQDEIGRLSADIARVTPRSP